MYEVIIQYKISVHGKESILSGSFASPGDTKEEAIENARPEIDKFLIRANGTLISIN